MHGEWDTCVGSSFANSGGSEGHRGRRSHDTQPQAGLKTKGNLMLNDTDLPSLGAFSPSAFFPFLELLSNDPSRL